MSLLERLLTRGGESGGRSAELEQALEKARNHLAELTAAHDRTWSISECDWEVDQETAAITFFHENGTIARAPVQIVGTYDTDDGTWLWGWDHPAVDEACSRDAKKLREYGLENAVPGLTTRKIECDEDDCWDFAALAVLICNSQGAYRGPSGSTLVFMTFGEVQLSQTT